MNNRHFNKNRAPKIGSSAFFSNKQERAQEHYNQYYNNKSKFKRPSRAIRRRNKDKESKVFRYRVLIKHYDELTKFKTFLTFLRKKSDISFLEDNNEPLTYDLLDVSKTDLERVCDMYSHYGVFVSGDHIAKHIIATVTIDISFTNRRIELSINRKLEQSEFDSIVPFSLAARRSGIITSNMGWGFSNDFLPIDTVDLTNNGHFLSENLKTILSALNKNIKHPKH